MRPTVTVDFEIGAAIGLCARVRRKTHRTWSGYGAVELPAHCVGALRDWPSVPTGLHSWIIPAGVDAAISAGHVLAVASQFARALMIDPSIWLLTSLALLLSAVWRYRHWLSCL